MTVVGMFGLRPSQVGAIAVVALVVVLAYERYGQAGKPKLRVAA